MGLFKIMNQENKKIRKQKCGKYNDFIIFSLIKNNLK